MKNKPTGNYSLIALILALLAVISTGIFGILKLAVRLQLYTIKTPEYLDRGLLISILAIPLFVAIYSILEPEKSRQFLMARQTRYGSNALLMSIAFFVIVVVLNYIFSPTSSINLNKTWDLTKDQQHTLAPETSQALKTLPEKIQATAFFSARMDRKSATDLLNNFKTESSGKFDYKFDDPDLNPVAAHNAGITGDGKILLQMGDHKEIAASADEQELLRALIRLTTPGEHVIYFLTGHGERDSQQAGNTSMNRANTVLTSKNYTVKTLNLQAENQIPADASLIVIAGPVKPLSDNEIRLLQGYLSKKGALIVMEDPTPLTNFGGATDPLANMLASDWGITLDNDITIDTTSPQPDVAVASYYDPNHPITQKMNNLVSLYPTVRSLTVAAVQDVTDTELVKTVNGSWGETDFSTLQSGVSFDPKADKSGPLAIVAAGENSKTSSRVVVFGGSEFATDQLFDQYGNGDIFVNSVDWAAQQEGLINITPHTATPRTFNLVPALQFYGILLSSVCVIPGIWIVAGIVIWVLRRRKG